MLALTSQINTPYHGVPAGVKMLILCSGTLLLFLFDDFWIRSGALAGVGALYLFAGRQFVHEGWRHLRPILLFIAIIALWHVVTWTLAEGARVILLLITAVALANLVTLTTKLEEMMQVIRWLTQPLRYIGLQSRVLELAIAMVIRFTPVLMQKGTALAEAWRSRSVRRPGWRIVIPLMLLAVDDADHVSDALRARGGL